MDNSLVKQYEDYFEMFTTNGWKLLMEDIEGMINSLDSISYVNTLEELHSYKGQLSMLHRLRGFENAITQAYEQLTEEEANEG